MIKLNDRLFLIPSTDFPLSSNVFVIEGDSNTYIYDIGSNNNVINELSKYNNLKLITSHFHNDHLFNLSRMNVCDIYTTKYTKKYINSNSNIIDEKLVINDGITIEIINFPSSHAKGFLVLLIKDYSILLISDALAPEIKNGHLYYNKQKLIEGIRLLKNLDFKYLYDGHKNNIILKDDIIKRIEKLLKLEDTNSLINVLEYND